MKSKSSEIISFKTILKYKKINFFKDTIGLLSILTI